MRCRRCTSGRPRCRNSRLPGFADTFMPHGRAPQVGERACLPGHAQTLRTLQKEGARAFYEGALAERIAAFSREGGARWPQPTCRLTGPNGSSRSASASASHDPRFRRTAGHRRADRARDCRARGRDRVASRFGRLAASADRGDGSRSPMSSLRRRSARDGPRPNRCSTMRIRRARETDRPARAALRRRPAHSGGTIYLSAADERGMMVSFIQSNYMGFGSSCPAPASRCRIAGTASRWIGFAERRRGRQAAVPRSSRRSSPRRSKAGPRP